MNSDQHTTANFQESKVNIRIKLSALWTAVMFCYVYGDYFSLYVPGKVQKFLNGDVLLNTPMRIVEASILMAVPALMIFLSVILKSKLSRILNIVFGIFYTALMLLIGFTTMAPWWSFYVFFAFLEAILTFTIIWTAVKWPRQSATDLS
jgi:Family of unknown function (DUF6326)